MEFQGQREKIINSCHERVVDFSSDLEEVMGLSHRVLVLARGRNMGILEGGNQCRYYGTGDGLSVEANCRAANLLSKTMRA